MLFTVRPRFKLFPQSQGNHQVLRFLVVGYIAFIAFRSPGNRCTVDYTDKSFTVRFFR